MDEIEDEYVTDDTEFNLDEDFDPCADLSDIWHPDVADTSQYSY